MGAPEHTVIWKPQEGPQTALLQCPVFEVFYGGARGGGKTESSIGDWVQHASLYGENAIGIFFRRKYKQLAEVIARTKQLFPKIGATWNEQRAEWKFPNGARLKFAYLERDSDAEEYQGHNYTRVYFEEVTNFPSPAPINKLRATLRSPTGVPCGMRLTGNPGGPGHSWVKKRYIDPCPSGYKVIYDEEEIMVDDELITVRLGRVFIPSKLRDNKLLMRNDPTYLIRLKQSGSEALVKAWLDGDWNIIDGAFFDKFDPDAHVLAAAEWIPRIPKNAKIFRAFDWGSAKPFSCGWYAISDGTWGLPRGALFKFREWYGAKSDNVGLKMNAFAVGQGIINTEKAHNILCAYGVADPAIFIQDGGPSIAQEMARAGCLWRRGDNRRQPGWEQVRVRLEGHLGDPMLYFSDLCVDTIRTLPLLQHDETNSEDLDTEGEDHAADETRYACMSRPWLPKAAGAPASRLPKLPQETTINELIQRQRNKRLAEAE